MIFKEKPQSAFWRIAIAWVSQNFAVDLAFLELMRYIVNC